MDFGSILIFMIFVGFPLGGYLLRKFLAPALIGRQAERQSAAELIRSALSDRDAISEHQLGSITHSVLREVAFRSAGRKTRRAATRMLWKRASEDQRDAILREIVQTHPDDAVRVDAAHEMKTIDAFVPLLQDPSAQMRITAFARLCTKPEYAKCIRDAIRLEPDPSVRRRLVETGAFNNDQRALESIGEGDADGDIRALAATILKEVRTREEDWERKKRDPQFGVCSRCQQEDVLHDTFTHTSDYTGEESVTKIPPLCGRCMTVGGYWRG